jgi:formylglycine-generating enzyme required for sulfatase activity
MVKRKNNNISNKNKAFRAIIVFVFALLGLSLWFAFSTVSIRFTTTPVNTNVQVVSGFSVPISDRFLLLPGSYELKAVAEGYNDLIQQIQVTSEANQLFPLELEAKQGVLTVALSPEVSGQSYIDGRYISETPFEIALSAGRYELEIKKEGYINLIQQLDIQGVEILQAYTYELTSDISEVLFETNPEGAEVYVDGKLSGITPVTLFISSGSHTVEYFKTDYERASESIYLEPEEAVTLEKVELRRQKINLTISSNPNPASIIINGAFIGVTPYEHRYSQGEELSINVTRLGYEPQQIKLPSSDNLNQVLSLELVPELAEIDITGDPQGAEISVDGDLIGTSPISFKVLALPHTLNIHLEGYVDQEYRINTQKDERYARYYELDLLNPLTGSGYQATYKTSLNQEMKLILPASFQMGSSRREQGRRSNEVIRNVTITKPYYLATQEVTNQDYRAFNPEHYSGSFAGISLDDDQNPVVGLTWNQVVEYLNWLSIKDELQPVYQFINGSYRVIIPLRNGYRLPTEAEWDRASRLAPSGDVITFGWGNTYPPDDRQANLADISASQLFTTILSSYSDGYPVTSEVQMFNPNNWGLFDLDGNVSEWVQDLYEVPITTDDELTDPVGPSEGRFHVYRGGNWRSAGISEIRLSYRGFSSESEDFIGFRIAKNGE